MSVRFLILLPLLILAACAPQAGRVFVDKSDRVMVLYDQKDKPIRTYRVALGGDPIGPKIEQGDNKTPEGSYTIDWRNAKSRFYKSLHISYPNAEDLKRAKEMGVKKPGHSIMIHGLGNREDAYRRKGDWTEGCIAVNNREISEIWNMVPNGTPILIVP